MTVIAEKSGIYFSTRTANVLGPLPCFPVNLGVKLAAMGRRHRVERKVCGNEKSFFRGQDGGGAGADGGASQSAGASDSGGDAGALGEAAARERPEAAGRSCSTAATPSAKTARATSAGVELTALARS